MGKTVSIWNYQERAAERKDNRLEMLRNAGIQNPEEIYDKLADESNRIQPQSKRDWENGGKRVWFGGLDPEVNANKWLREMYSALAPYFSGQKITTIEQTADYLASQWVGAVQWCDAGGAAEWGAYYPKVAEDYAWQRLITDAEKLLGDLNLPFPNGKTERSAMLRLQDAKWWRKQLNVAIPRIIDQKSREYRQVHADNDKYISNAAFELWLRRQHSNQKTLEAIYAVNEQGQEYTLAELAEKSISNPENRRTELMVRCRGLEEYAEANGFTTALFTTITAPSKYHSHNQEGVQYANWNYSNPRGVNDYLNGVWSRIRAELGRVGVNYFGVRVVEPHHDGCPHWHVLIFSSDAGPDRIESIIDHYAKQEDPHENGIEKYRVKHERIDPRKGSAVGYITKYISKNINGHAIETDLFDGDAKDAAKRIRAWASTWGIRQFQFFGCAAIGPYRELRKVRNRQVPEPYEKARAAADIGEFCEYLKQNDIYQYETWRPNGNGWVDMETGEIYRDKKNNFGEFVPPPIKGVLAIDPCNGSPCEGITTRLMVWTIETEAERQRKASAARSVENAEPWTCVNNCTAVVDTTNSASEALQETFGDFALYETYMEHET